MMHCYDVGIIDHYTATYPLQEYLDTCVKPENKWWADNEIDNVMTDLLKALITLYACKSCWEGEVRSNDDLRIGALPVGDCSIGTEYYFIFKQDNNGHTFVVSPYKMPWLGEKTFLSEPRGINVGADIKSYLASVKAIMNNFNWHGFEWENKVYPEDAA